METDGRASTAQQYNLKWTNHTNNILEMFSEQLSHGLLVDVTLFCDGQCIRAHKMVLSACSPYFQELFNGHKVDHPVIFMNGVRFVAVKQMVEFMYQGEIKVSDEDLDQLLALAENLQIKGLCKIKRENEDSTSTPIKNEPYLDDSNLVPSGNTPKRRKRRKLSQSPASAIDEMQTNGDYSSANQSTENLEELQALGIPTPPRRPKNAFMIFAGEWRKKLAHEHKGESNKEISTRLGTMWKNLSSDEKDEYFMAAKKVVDEHRLKYPDWHLAKEARQALKRRRSTNPKQFKRKTPGKNDKLGGLDLHTQTNDPVEPPPSKDNVIHNDTTTNSIKSEPDENNLVIAESQDSSGENTANSKT